MRFAASRSGSHESHRPETAGLGDGEPGLYHATTGVSIMSASDPGGLAMATHLTSSTFSGSEVTAMRAVLPGPGRIQQG